MSDRPPTRWCHAQVLLEDFAIINWTVDPDRLRHLLPPEFEADQHDGTASIAMVAFNNRRFHFRAAPFARFSCGQADYRTFVRHGDERGVWFFGGSLSSRLVGVATALWKMPWHYDSIAISPSSSGDSTDHWSFDSAGKWGAAKVTLSTTGRDFPNAPSNPTLGWYPRRGGGIGRYSVWHPPLELREATAEATRCDVFERLGLIEAGQSPSAAGFQGRVEFDVHTPPTKLERGID